MLFAVFALATAATALLLAQWSGPRDPVQYRLTQIAHRRELLAAGQDGAGQADPPLDPSGTPLVGPGRGVAWAFRRALGRMNSRVEERRWSKRLSYHLRRAGLRMLPAEFIACQSAVAFAGLALLSLLGYGHLWWVILPAGFIGPATWLKRRGRARTSALENQLPDTLALIANSLRSGFSFLQALEVVSREMPDPIARESAQVLRENRFGIPLDAALTAMAERMGSADLDLVITAVLIQRQVGGNLAEVVNTIGETIKGRLQLLGQVRTLTSQGRFSGWVVSLLPVVLGVALYLLNPEYIMPLLRNPFGWALLGIGVLMQGIGILVIRKLVHLEV